MNDDEHIATVSTHLARRIVSMLHLGPNVPMLSGILLWQAAATMAEEALRTEATPEEWAQYERIKATLTTQCADVSAELVAEMNARRN